MLMTSFVASGTVESFDTAAFGASLAAELNVSASDVIVTAQAASILVSVTIVVPEAPQRGAGDRRQHALCRPTAHAERPRRHGGELHRGRRSSTFRRRRPRRPRHRPDADVCAADGSDDTCAPFENATWSSALPSYHFYLYDETPDGVDVRLWEWPRVTPRTTSWRTTAFARTASGRRTRPSRGRVLRGLWRPRLRGAPRQPEHGAHRRLRPRRPRAVHARHRLRRLRAQRGADGRRRRRRTIAAREARRGCRRCRARDDAHELRHLDRTLTTASSYHLPKPWLQALQVTDHWTNHPPSPSSGGPNRTITCQF